MKSVRLVIFMMPLVSSVACGLAAPDPTVDDIASAVTEPPDGGGADPSPRPTSPPRPRVVSSHEIANATFSDCPEGDLCFFTGFNGTGSMCHWNVADPDWTTGQDVCSWALTSNVCSIFNRWTGTVDYYTAPDFHNHIGSTQRDVAGNLACTYKLRSHQ